jgi:hypothetical protein
VRLLGAIPTITTTDGTSIHYADWGDGPAVVLSRGWVISRGDVGVPDDGGLAARHGGDVRAFTEMDFRPDVAAIRVPTLVIHGDGDAGAPLEITAAAAPS